MTLIIGVCCGDGVVIGADSMATYGSPDGSSTVAQEIDSKIEKVGETMIFASSGAVGLSQEVLDSLDKYWDKNKNKKYMNVRKGIAETIFKPIEAYVNRAKVTAPLFGQPAVDSAYVASVIAFPSENRHVLIHYDAQANPEEFNSQLPFVAIGSGQSQADPFLAFIKEAVWNGQQPDSVQQGIVGVLWALEHVIQVNAGHGVGGDPSIGVLEKDDSGWKASVLAPERLFPYRKSISDAKQVLNEELNKPITKSDVEGTLAAPPRFDQRKAP